MFKKILQNVKLCMSNTDYFFFPFFLIEKLSKRYKLYCVFKFNQYYKYS